MNFIRQINIKIIFLILIQINFGKAQSLLLDKSTLQNFNAWNEECVQTNVNKTFINTEKVLTVCKSFFETMENTINKTEWIKNPIRFNNAKQEFLKSKKRLSKEKTYSVKHIFKDSIFKYAQKQIINKETITLVVGDIHGSYNTLKVILNSWIENGYLDENLKLKNNVKAVFLGDYEDRGVQGSEIILTLMQLKVINPEQLILMRGNHEHYYYNETEIQNKYPKKWNSVCRILNASFEILPDVLYLGYENSKNKTINSMQLNHGGMERNYNPKKLFLNQNNKILEELSLKHINFKWSYIIRQNKENEMNRYLWEGIEMKEQHNTKVIEYIKNTLQKKDLYKVAGMIKGHNHETPKKETLHNLFPEKLIGLSELKCNDLIKSYPNISEQKTAGYCNIGTVENPIIVTIAGPMHLALPIKGNSQKYAKGLNYAYTYIILKPNEKTPSGWEWEECCIE